MTDRIQAAPPRQTPSSDRQEYEAVDFRKVRSGVSGWMWVLIAVPVLMVLGCVGLAGVGLFLHSELAPQSVPPATAPAVPMPAPQPGDK